MSDHLKKKKEKGKEKKEKEKVDRDEEDYLLLALLVKYDLLVNILCTLICI